MYVQSESNHILRLVRFCYVIESSVHLIPTCSKMERDYVNFCVSGMSYSLFLEDIEKYPESYFSAVIKKEWSPEQDVPINIERCGRMFRYIVEFHHHGELAFKVKKASVDLVRRIQDEGDFYNLPSLVKACEKYLLSCVNKCIYSNSVTNEYWTKGKDDLINVLGGLWSPFCTKGFQYFADDCNILKSSTLLSINLDELCEAAEKDQCGNDRNNHEVLEISADKLNPKLWNNLGDDRYPLRSFAPRMTLEIRPRKLLIYKEGGHIIEHSNSECRENHIGKLVHILKSTCTGGDVVVRQNDIEMSISRPGEWMALYNSALCAHRTRHQWCARDCCL